ncbi:MAG: ferredoxin [Novosphingobium sp.]
MESVRIIVHREKCQGHARCWALAPDLFDLDDEGFIVPGDVVASGDDAQRARRAARACPERALEIEG